MKKIESIISKNGIIYQNKMNTMIQLSRQTIKNGFKTTIPELTFSASPFRYLGLIKNIPHFINPKNEVYYTNVGGNLEYSADWLEEHKMLWTDNPISYRLITLNGVNYFYDLEYYDTYTYDYNKDQVKYIGEYCPEFNFIYEQIK